ncbi:MAG: serine/threonine protein kinase [Blastocatellia bacterium]|nr:serine/threonine protein kinase [Blastocatellia bacterium]
MNLIGEVLDEKYQIEKQLGAGGMGAVYLATHLHTKSPVAVKVITPEFAEQREFIERFRREAEAAGRLRHPNVVYVTDFGFTRKNQQNLAYLVMEYLDGQPLSGLLRQQPRLPLEVAVDILEQVSLAIQKAHDLGIVHRDLKPDNIWLEPNGRGGFNVKVLDFGIAKLRSKADVPLPGRPTGQTLSQPTQPWGDATHDFHDQPTVAQTRPDDFQTAPTVVTTQAGHIHTAPTLPAVPTETGASDITVAQTRAWGSETGTSEAATLPLLHDETEPNRRLESTTTPALTRVGALIGTPAYMSPEQCAGKVVDHRSDIYSLAVIAFQMLAGELPFSGNLAQLLQQHCQEAPPSLREKRPDVPLPVAEAIAAALAKAPEDRPATALAFTTLLRVQTGGLPQLQEDALLLIRSQDRHIRRSTTLVQLPFIVLGSSLTAFLMVPWPTALRGAEIIQGAGWVLLWFMFLLACQFGTAAAATMMYMLEANPQQPLAARTVFRRVWGQGGRLVRETLRHWLHLPVWSRGQGNPLVQELLVGSVAGTEHQPAPVSHRTAQLAATCSELGLGLQGRRFVLSLYFMLLTMVVYTVISQGYAAWMDPELAAQMLVTALFCMAAMLLWLVSFFPVWTAAVAVLYFTARQIRNETAVAVRELAGKLAAVQPPAPRQSRWRTPIAVVCLLVLLVGAYNLLVPPFGAVPVSPATQFTSLPKEENAWTDYRVALRKLGAGNDPDDPFPDGLGQFCQWKKDNLTDAEKAFVERNQEALLHLQAGNKRPHSQMVDNPAEAETQIPRLLEAKALVFLALSQSRLWLEAGKPAEALDLCFAAWRFSNSFTDPNAGLFGFLEAAATRKISLNYLYGLVSRQNLAPELHRDIAQRLAAHAQHQVSPASLLESEQAVMAGFLHRLLIQQQRHTSFRTPVLLDYTPGLRLRVYQRMREFQQNSLAAYQPALASWDLPRLQEIEREINHRLERTWPRSLSDLISRQLLLISEPTMVAPVNSLYQDQAYVVGLRALVAVEYFHQRQQRYPQTLAEATQELGMPPLTDFVSGQPLGYRLEQGTPVWWLPGLDRRDDQGRQNYTAEALKTPTEGSDILFRKGSNVWFDRKN